MDTENVGSHAKGLMIKISLVTGWVIPEDQRAKNVLYEQFARKLVESYSSLNVQEVDFAIRNYGTEIKDWGKLINLSIIDAALQPYLNRRSEIRKLEESVIKPMQLMESFEPVDNDKLVELARETFLKTKLAGIIPATVYDILVEQKEIDLDVEEKAKIRTKVEKRLSDEAVQDGLNAIRKFKDLKNNKKNYEILVRNECKKEAVANYFTLQDQIDNF